MKARSLSSIGVAAITLLAVLLGACQTMSKTPIDESSSADGLQRVQINGVDAVYRKPGTSLSGYSRLLVHPVRVEFSKNWKPEQSSALYSMNKIDREKIRTELAAAFREEFVKELQVKGGYQLVDEPAADVLEVTPAIVNLYINAPDVSMQTAARVKTYTTETGEMTLIAELRDSVTGELLTRVYDRHQGSTSGPWQWTNSVTNTAEAKRAIAGWASILREGLDSSRKAPAKP